MKSKNTTYSLHFTTSTLFIFLIIVFGGILSWQHYRKISEILIASGDQVFNQINSELKLDFSSLRKSVKQTVHFIALSPIAQADTLAERLQSLLLLSTALVNDENMSALQIAYANGDYFIIRPIRSSYEIDTFSAPNNTAFVVDDIATQELGKRVLLRLFYDENLQEIGRDLASPSDYDPRGRPWYKLAVGNNAKVRATAPYLFYFLRKVGLTLTMKSPLADVVVAADVTLNQLSHTLIRMAPTPKTEIVVFGEQGDALIYKDINRLVIKNSVDDFQIAKLSQLGSDVLSFLSKDLQLVSQSLHFQFNGETWLGAIRKMQISEGHDFFVLMVSPESELLSTANKIREQSLILTAVILVLTIPIIWFFARQISNPIRHLAIEAGLISRFDFGATIKTRSLITEVDELADAMRMMKSTISQFLALIHSLAGEQNFDALLQRITQQTSNISQADAALTYLYNEKNNSLEPKFMHIDTQDIKELEDIPVLPLDNPNGLVNALHHKASSIIELNIKQANGLNALLKKLDTDTVKIIALPLRNRQEETIGLLCLLYKQQATRQRSVEQIAFVQELSGFAAVSIESRQLLMMQKALLDSFIKLIADAIDSKSPYTGEHCARVPVITRLLAQAACASNEGPFQDFNLNQEQWESLHIASWLHDCGKVTTPEYVVDKSTKLETIYDRIHEIRMRVEVLKRDAEIDYWKQLAKGSDAVTLGAKLDAKLAQLDDDFAFIAECNEGGEFMAAEKKQRLREIADYTWMRTLDDGLGISWEEKQRKQGLTVQPIAVAEKLLADKTEHIIAWNAGEKMAENNPWGFQLDVPQYKYNRGEIYNLSVERGTLTKEERFIINNHIVQTIIMLDNLPYPKHLAEVPKIAGSHHERMDGTGYPRRLTAKDMPLTARIMAIADIFEALTASDRPYKKAKTLKEALQIMDSMVKDQHIDADLFKLFLNSGVYRDYGRKFLQPEQIEEVDLTAFL